MNIKMEHAIVIAGALIAASILMTQAVEYHPILKGKYAVKVNKITGYRCLIGWAAADVRAEQFSRNPERNTPACE